MEFSQNVAQKMLTYQNFCHISEIYRQIPRDNPSQQNHPNNAKTRQNVEGNMLGRVRLPAFFQYSFSKIQLQAFGLLDDGNAQIANLGSGEGKNWLL
jgi:hypothetical protein